MLSVTAKPHPFRDQVLQLALPAGGTLTDILLEVATRGGVSPGLLAYAAVTVDEAKVPAELWATVRPKDGRRIVVNALPGDDFGSLFVTLAGFALGAFIPPLGGLAFAGVNIGQLVVRGAITLATSLIAQAIAPSPRQTLSGGREDAPTASYTITGTRNEARPYGVVPVVYGRILNYHPPLAALPYTETWSADQQYIRMLFGIEGRASFSNIKVGDTPIGNLKNTTYEVRTGASTDTDPGLFPRQVREQSLSVELRQVQGFTYRTTEPDTDEVSIEIVFPNGMGRVTDRNVKFGINVQFQVLYYGPGMSGYNAAPLQQDAGGGVTINGGGVFTISGYSKAVVRRSVRFLVPRGQYSVGVARITIDDQSDNTGDNQSTTFETSYLSTLRSIQYQAPVTRDGLALIAVRAQASDQLNGVIDTLNCTVERLLPVWNGSSWSSPQATRNPAWAFCDVLRGPGNARPLDDTRIDLATILTWAQACDAQGLTFDAVIADRRSVWEMLQEIAATGFASPTVRDGKFSVVHDTTRSTPVQHFSPRNSRNFQVTRLYGDLPHVLKVRFPNAATLHQVDEIRVYDDGYTAANATREEVLDLPYTTSATLAYRAARRYLATARLRPRVVSLDTDLEFLICERGDLVRVTHDTALIGLGAARVKALSLDGGGNLTAVTLDAAMPVGSASYALRFRTATGATIYAPVTAATGEQVTFTLATPIAAGDPMPAIGDHALYGEAGSESREFLVRSIEPRADLSATLTLVDYAPAIFTAASGPIPDYDPGITLRPTFQKRQPPKPVILSVDSDEDTLVQLGDGTLLARILIAYEVRQTSDTLPAVRVTVRWRETDSAADPQHLYQPAGAGQISLMPVEEGATYTVEIRSESEFGLTSEWATVTHTVLGKTSPPPAVETLYRQRTAITWDYPNPPRDLAGFRVKAHYGTATDWASARALHAGLVPGPPFDIAELDGTQVVLVCAVDTSGNESSPPAQLTLNLGDPIVENVLLTQDEHPAWAGSITGGTVAAGLLEADSTTLFWAPDAATFWLASGAATFWPTDTFLDLVYVARYTPIADHVGAVVKLALDVTGTYAVDYRIAVSPTFWGSGGSTFWGADGSSFWATETLGAWQPWPGVLGPIDSTSEEYDVRVSVAGGLDQGVLTELSLLIDVPDILEYFEDVAISSGGTRLPITQTYRVIKSVQVTVQDDGGTAASALILDKDATLGPEIKTINTSRTGVNGLVDAVVQGY